MSWAWHASGSILLTAVFKDPDGCRGVPLLLPSSQTMLHSLSMELHGADPSVSPTHQLLPPPERMLLPLSGILHASHHILTSSSCGRSPTPSTSSSLKPMSVMKHQSCGCVMSDGTVDLKTGRQEPLKSFALSGWRQKSRDAKHENGWMFRRCSGDGGAV